MSDGRPISFASSSFVGLLGSGALMAREAREGLGSSREFRLQLLVEGPGSRAGVCATPRVGFADIFGMPRRWGERVYRRQGMRGIRGGHVGRSTALRGRRSWERKAIGLVDPASPAASRRVGRRRQAFGEVAPRRTQTDSSAAAVAAKSRSIPRSRVCRPSRCEPDDPPLFLTRSKKRGGERH